ncbi:MAG: chemotaxis protein CheA [Planctomycetota bacterium]
MDMQLLDEFLTESAEAIDQLDLDLIELERSSDDPEIVSRIFRCVHTMKGTSGFLELLTLGEVAHAGENLLSDIRDGDLDVSTEIISVLLELNDSLRELVDEVRDGQYESRLDYSGLISKLETLRNPGEAAAAEPSELQAAADLDDLDAAIEEQLRLKREEAASQEAAADPPPVEDAEQQQSAKPAEPSQEATQQPAKAEANAAAKSNAARSGDSTIRVCVDLLDELMNLVGELVLTRNQLVMLADQNGDSSFITTTQRLNVITTELQQGLMKTRMQPIRTIWDKVPRIVRDLSVSFEKQIRVEMDGQETELDKTLVEALKDPLTHIVRNSADHGIESPEERLAAGKPAEGCLSLRAYHEGGQVYIEIADDGAGVNTQRVAEKAISKGIVTRTQVDQMSQRDLTQLIFAAGFSTAEQVTNISGRGVGMDVVRTSIQKIGGTVEIDSKQGRGTKLTIKMPLTLAIIPALIVRADDNDYAIPQLNLVELLRLEGEEIDNRIDFYHGAPVCRLRGKLLPLAVLGDVLRGERSDYAARLKTDSVSIVVLQADQQRFGLVVDGVRDTEEIVVKSLCDQLKPLGVYAGSTIFGDGSVGLILDASGIAKSEALLQEGGKQAEPEQQASPVDEDLEQVLVVEAGEGQRIAVPMEHVVRLEQIAREKVEQCSGRDVVQYREDVLPLVNLTELTSDRRAGSLLAELSEEPDEEVDLPVVVFRTDHGHVGLVVSRICDSTEVAKRPLGGVDGESAPSIAVVDGRTIEVVDLDSRIGQWTGA